MNTKTRVGVFAAILSAFIGGASAQERDETAVENNVLEEIIVTATKRATSLQDTAIRISVIGASTIE